MLPAATHTLCQRGVTLANVRKAMYVCGGGECGFVCGVIAVNVAVADSVCTVYLSGNKC